MFSRDVFVPNGDSRKDTAIILVGTAREYGIDQRSIKTVAGGFHITSELADLVYDEANGAYHTSELADLGYDAPETEQIEAEQIEAVPEAEQIEPVPEAEQPKKQPTKKTSGNRAAKNVTEKE
jgi:hypothetical protein